MNAYQARAFIEQVLSSPNIYLAQTLVDSNLADLDATFFQVLETMIRKPTTGDNLVPTCSRRICPASWPTTSSIITRKRINVAMACACFINTRLRGNNSRQRRPHLRQPRKRRHN